MRPVMIRIDLERMTKQKMRRKSFCPLMPDLKPVTMTQSEQQREQQDHRIQELDVSAIASL